MDGTPVLHVLGGGVRITDLTVCPPPADPGEHGGDAGTAITVGRYLYPAPPDWIADVRLARIHVERPGHRASNSIALMGAVRDVALDDVTVHGGYTGVAVHWGAVGAGVGDITGPSYHPHHLAIRGLRVDDAVEGFYLSSVHDVLVSGAHLHDVEMGFRLLPGDNTDRFLRDPAAVIGERIEVRDVCVRWTGERYAVRVAGWGRSEIDGMVTMLRYADTVIRDCVLYRGAAAPAHHQPSPTSRCGRPLSPKAVLIIVCSVGGSAKYARPVPDSARQFCHICTNTSVRLA
jgi:hypothetical protein